jgi:hypothetical protein
VRQESEQRKRNALKELVENYCNKEVIDYYTDTINYVLAESPRDADEIEAFRIFAGLLMMKLDSDEIEFGCSISACLATEAMLRRYRKERHLDDAADFGLESKNWRREKTGWSPVTKAFFRELQKEVPSRLWDLRGIDVNVFANLMLPKLKAEGRLDASSGEVRSAQLN